LALTLPIQSLQPLSSTGDARPADLRAQLNAGQTLSGSVREVTLDPSRPNLFRLKVEVQNQLMELITSRPLSTGAQISLARGSNGGLELTLNPNTQRPGNAAGSAESGARQPVPNAPATGARNSSGLTLQIPTNSPQGELLARMLPLNQPQAGRVLPNVIPASSTAAQSPAPTASSGAHAASPSAVATTAPATTAAPAQAATGSSASPSPPTSTSPPAATQAASAAGVTRQTGAAPPPTQGQPTSTPAATTSASARAQTGAASGSSVAATTQGSTAPPPPTAPPQPAATTARAAGAGASAAASTPAGPMTGTPQPVSPIPAPAATNNITAPPATPPATPSTAAPPATSGAGSSRGQAPVSANTTTPTPTASPAPTSATAPRGPQPVQIAVNGQRIELLSQRPLQAGLAVQLTRTDQNNVQLQVQPPQVSPAGQARLQEGLQQVLRETLPQQIPMADALNQLRQLGNSTRQGDAIGQVVKSMLSLFSVPAKPDAGSTRQALQNQLQASGMMRPASGGQPQASLQEPLARLGQLAEQLPGDARERVQTLLQGLKARAAVNQASSLQRWQDQPDGGIERQYRLDLPIRLDEQRLENTEIRINQHRRRDDQDRLVSEWSINLHFDIEPIGAIDARISLLQEWQLSARFWAEQGETTQRIRQRLPDFEAQLRHSGFQIEALHVQQGRPPREEQPAMSRRLVDLHT
jgi:hypothetical protein